MILEGALTINVRASWYDHSFLAFNSSLNDDMLQYWKHPGALNRANLVHSNINTDRFLAFLSVIVLASFSYQGAELVAM